LQIVKWVAKLNIKNNDTFSKQRNINNIKASMLAAASKIEGGDMEFF